MGKQQLHFGQWFKRVREKLGMTQGAVATELGLESYISVRNIEHKAERSMRGTTNEAMLDFLGYQTDADLDAAWQAGRLPDLDAIRTRVMLKSADAMKRTLAEKSAHFDARLTARLFRWLASHPKGQILDMMMSVSKEDAAVIAQVLVQRVAAGDDGEEEVETDA